MRQNVEFIESNSGTELKHKIKSQNCGIICDRSDGEQRCHLVSPHNLSIGLIISNESSLVFYNLFLKY